ncbi:YciI family protein [Actinopolymorpha alba]|uniref:YciI family protein n=1 Tax=Actinopolymorpha alba TaxID=533267 RepID=UPI000360D93C|nr:YciI family protein [Actinopolymorpha alba]
MAIFAVVLAFKNNDRRLDVRPAHREYLTSLHAAGKLVSSGPWTDDTGALLLYNVADEAEVREILANDPYTSEDVYDIVDLREWRPLFPFQGGPSAS